MTEDERRREDRMPAGCRALLVVVVQVSLLFKRANWPSTLCFMISLGVVEKSKLVTCHLVHQKEKKKLTLVMPLQKLLYMLVMLWKNYPIDISVKVSSHLVSWHFKFSSGLLFSGSVYRLVNTFTCGMATTMKTTLPRRLKISKLKSL